MWNKFKKRKALCVEYREALEDLRAGVGEAEGDGGVEEQSA